jgi:glutathione peroxidase-family protein
MAMRVLYVKRDKLVEKKLFERLLPRAARTGQPPRWNFHKYLLDRTGQPVAAFESAIEPEDRRITSEIEKLLAAR